MKYSLYSVINSDYNIFGKIWINSAIDKLDMDDIENIFLVDSGLNNSDRDYFSGFDKVTIVNSGISTNLSQGVHGKGWLDTVKMKTKILMEVIDVNNSYPIVMVDLDCMFIRDISYLIDESFDIQACFRGWENPHAPYLACFTVVNNSKGRKFLKIWNSYIDGIKTPNKESPALTKAVKLHGDKFKVGDIDNITVNGSTIKDIERSDIIHFKSQYSVPTIKRRIWEAIVPNGFGAYVKKYLR